MDNVLFSVIMPCYNSEKYVADAVESLLNQTYNNWELIAVNDGSADDTLGILKDFAEKDKRIKVFSKGNGGYATAMNYGLDKVFGDYFLMMGSDDRLDENLLLEINKAISAEKSSPDMIAFRAIKYKDGKFLEKDFFSDFDNKASMFNASISDFNEKYPQNSFIFCVRDTAKCFKASLLGELRYFGKYGYDADGIFSMLFSHKCHSFLSLPLDGYRWTIRGDSISSSIDKKTNIDRVKVWNEYLKAINSDKKLVLPPQENRFVSSAFRVCNDLLKQKSRISLYEMLIMHKALRRSIKIAKKRDIYLLNYHEIFIGNPIRKRISLMFPVLWLIKHRTVDILLN